MLVEDADIDVYVVEYMIRRHTGESTEGQVRYRVEVTPDGNDSLGIGPADSAFALSMLDDAFEAIRLEADTVDTGYTYRLYRRFLDAGTGYDRLDS